MNGVVLIQTDTTVGFVSQNARRLAQIKSRSPEKPFLKTYASFSDFKKEGRIPAAFRRHVRRSEKTTYVVKSKAFRIVAEGSYHLFLRPFGWAYSTSANASGATFDEHFARTHADLVVEDYRGFVETEPSRICKINHRKQQRIR